MSTKARNKVIFLTCILAFLGVGFALYRQWVDRKPFAVILFVADGLTPSNLAAARLFNGGADFRFNMESMPNMALASPRAKDYAVADAAAAATSIATGQEETRRDGIETIEAIRQLKALHPTVQTTLGLFNHVKLVAIFEVEPCQ